jgi:hypothetical protein
VSASALIAASRLADLRDGQSRMGDVESYFQAMNKD